MFSQFPPILLIVLSLGLVSCGIPSPFEGAYYVRVPIDNGQGQYPLQNIELKTVINLSAMEAGSVVIKNRGMIIRNLDNSNKITSVTFHEGFAPRARFIRSAGVHIASDYESLMMATVLANFESLKVFYEKFGATKGMVFPQKVMMQPEQSTVSEKLKQSVSNNASFHPVLNLFILNASSSQVHIPILMNSGVLAHEYFHSVFYSYMKDSLKVFNILHSKLSATEIHEDGWSAREGNRLVDNETIMSAMNADCAAAQGVAPPAQKNKVLKSNKFVVEALNEALADYFAYEFTKNPSWPMASSPELSNRDVSLPKHLSCNDEGQKNWLVRNTQIDRILNTHHVGAIFAHFLFKTAEARKKEGNPLSTSDQAIRFLSKLNQHVSLRAETEAFTLADMAELFISSAEKPDRASCEAARLVFAGSAILRTGICGEVR